MSVPEPGIIVAALGAAREFDETSQNR